MGSFIAVVPSGCTGCKTCEVICSLSHVGACNPEKSAIRVRRQEEGGLVSCVPAVCQQCEDPACIEACPVDALSREAGGVGLTIDAGACTGCELCVDACGIGGLAIDGDAGRAISCDLCGGQMLCVPACHAGCLSEEPAVGETRRAGFERLSRALEEQRVADNDGEGRAT